MEKLTFLPCPLGIPGTASYGTGSGGFTCCGPHTFVICSSFIISIVSACGTDSLDCQIKRQCLNGSFLLCGLVWRVFCCCFFCCVVCCLFWVFLTNLLGTMNKCLQHAGTKFTKCTKMNSLIKKTRCSRNIQQEKYNLIRKSNRICITRHQRL